MEAIVYCSEEVFSIGIQYWYSVLQWLCGFLEKANATRATRAQPEVLGFALCTTT